MPDLNRAGAIILLAGADFADNASLMPRSDRATRGRAGAERNPDNRFDDDN